MTARRKPAKRATHILVCLAVATWARASAEQIPLAYVLTTDRARSVVVVVDVATGVIRKTLRISHGLFSPDDPPFFLRALEAAAVSDELFVAIETEGDAPHAFISVLGVNRSTHSVIRDINIPLPGVEAQSVRGIPIPIRLTPDGRRLFVMTPEALRVLDLGSRKTVARVPIPFSDFCLGAQLVPAPGGERLYCLSFFGLTPTVSVVDVPEGRVRRYPLPEPATDLDLSPDGAELFVASGEGVVVLNAASGEEITKVPIDKCLDGTQRVKSVTASPDGTRILATLDPCCCPPQPGVVVIDAASFRKVDQIEVGGLALTTRAVLTPDGTKLVAGVLLPGKNPGEPLEGARPALRILDLASKSVLETPLDRRAVDVVVAESCRADSRCFCSVAADCDDGNKCTDDGCEEVDACRNSPRDRDCFDRVACSFEDPLEQVCLRGRRQVAPGAKLVRRAQQLASQGCVARSRSLLHAARREALQAAGRAMRRAVGNARLGPIATDRPTLAIKGCPAFVVNERLRRVELIRGLLEDLSACTAPGAP